MTRWATAALVSALGLITAVMVDPNAAGFVHAAAVVLAAVLVGAVIAVESRRGS